MNIVDISYIEELSMLRLNDQEKAIIKAQLDEILSSEGMVSLATLDTTGVAECVQPLDRINDFRDDELLPPFPQELILQNAKEHSADMFIAPRTVGD